MSDRKRTDYRAKRMGFVFQFYNLMPVLSAVENVELPRAVVERRQQIGVLRAIGFRQGMVQAVFLIESSFIALTSIAAGTILGLILAENIVHDSAKQPSWENLTLVVPWGTFAVVFLAVYAVALAATLAPAIRASRVHPAEALRYQ
jgi:putative ABC transport system permease protein